MAEDIYYEKQKEKDVKLLREILKDLPPILNEFFINLGNYTSNKTRLAYAYDLKIFFNYLKEFHLTFKDLDYKNISYKHLEEIKASDIDMFLEYTTFYEQNEKVNSNDERGKLRKLSTLRTMYKFYYKREKIQTNPASLVEAPKVHEKPIVRLDINEMCDLLDEVEKGENLTEKQKQYHNRTRKRDLALISLLVGTGMRVSECVGINRSDINFSTNGVKVRRKGGSEVILYFGDEVLEALNLYLEERENSIIDNEEALFLSLQGKRIGVRAVQNLVKKYAKVSVSLKNISPHKLRSTYGTNLYQATGDIYLVANTLGHADVNTTRKHYAQIEEEARRSATSKINLRRT